MKRIQIFLLIITSVFLSVSCKKEFTEQPGAAGIHAENFSIQHVKAFYQKAVAAGQHSASFDQSPLIKYMNDSIEWDRAMYFPEQKTYIVPVFFLKTKMNESYKSFKFLVFTEQGGSYTGFNNTVIAGKDFPLDAFDENKAMEEIIKELQSGSTEGIRHIKYSLDYAEPLNKDHLLAVKEQTPQSSLQGVPQSDYVDPTEECQDNGGTMITIDWYFQTYINGNLVYEEYLYSTQECSVVLAGGGGGGATSSPCGSYSLAQINSILNSVQNVGDGPVQYTAGAMMDEGGQTPVVRQVLNPSKLLERYDFLGGIYYLNASAKFFGVRYKTRKDPIWRWESINFSTVVGLSNQPLPLCFTTTTTGSSSNKFISPDKLFATFDVAHTVTISVPCTGTSELKRYEGSQIVTVYSRGY